ncbi:MAG: 50S ribosomal protein L21 [Syntrophobacterales bacterium]|jgi:large subunit ribosomal protein L21|nr:50S ribosomal protein L21 [Syntrophobacterales bacterium]
MYAIIKNGGKQYRIAEGMKVRLELFPNAEGEEVDIREVLAVNNEAETLIGSPYVEGAHVQGKILSHGKARKVTTFKYKRRKDYKKKIGHRQPYTELFIEKIFVEALHGA